MTDAPTPDRLPEALDALVNYARAGICVQAGILGGYTPDFPAINKLLADMADAITALRAENEAQEKAITEEIANRDAAEAWADRLARAIGGDTIGDHSSANSPWENALVLAEALTARATAAEAERDAAVAAALERKTFPILGSNGARIDYQLVLDHGEQAKRNHYQTVDRLAERGGLSWSELHAVLHNRPFQKMDQNSAISECRALESRYLAPQREALAALIRQAEVRGMREAAAIAKGIREACEAEERMHKVMSYQYDSWLDCGYGAKMVEVSILAAAERKERGNDRG